MKSEILLPLLQSFCVSDPDTVWGKPRLLYAYRGDGSQTGDNHLRAMLGEERYAHLHWDTVATDGRIVARTPRAQLPISTRTRFFDQAI